MGDDNQTAESTNKKQKREISLKIEFLKINNIDTKREEYEADVFIQARWWEPTLDSANKDKINSEVNFDPKLKIHNNIGKLERTKEQEWEHDSKEGVYVVEKQEIKGKFFEKLELKNFPFDIQDLSIIITSDTHPNDVELVEDTKSLSKVNVGSFRDQQEWSMYNYVVGEQSPILDEYSRIKDKRPAFAFHCCAVRRTGYFIWNIMLITAMISSLSFATFSVDRELPQNRLQLSLTLVLTMVSFKLVASQSVPKVSYLTYLDRYILLSMVFLFLVCCWHAVVSLFKTDDNLATKMDYYAFFTFIGLYLLGQVVFILIVAIGFLLRRRSKELLEKDYREKVAKLLTEEGAIRRRKKQKSRTMQIHPTS